MALSFHLRRRPPSVAAIDSEVIERGLLVALRPDRLGEQPDALRPQVEEVAKALTMAPGAWHGGPGNRRPGPIDVRTLATRAAAQLAPSSSVTPPEIEVALRRQGLDWVEPFAPGRPLVPYYGYGRRPRGYDYKVGRNVTTETRPDRIPFAQLKQVIESYDIALACIRYIINDLRSMPLQWGPMEGYLGDVSREIEQAREFWRRPDGNNFFADWLAMAMVDELRYDASALYRERGQGQKVVAVKVIDGTTLAPMLDYFGDWPQPPAPAFQQFIQGVPWDWLTLDQIIYSRMWPVPESPFGVAPIETLLINANTDVRLQLFFLQFFTAGSVPEMLFPAPRDMSDPDSIAELQEDIDNWAQGNQASRHGIRIMPDWDHPPLPYKQIEQLDPKIAEYVIRRTIAGYGLTPQNLGVLDDVNRATADTQQDQQFRVGTLPHVFHWQAVINAVTQEDLGLPVAAHFDIGREAEDRLMDAQAHQIYVSIGAESPDEVRDKVLGLKVDNDSRVPRFYDNARLGPVPLGYIVSTAGKTDPTSLAPVVSSVRPQDFVAIATRSGGAVATEGPQTPSQEAPPGYTPPPLDSRQVHQQGAEHTEGHRYAQPPDVWQQGAKALDDEARADLTRWRRQSRDRVRRGKAPREFQDHRIPQDHYQAVWKELRDAATQEAVDEAFVKAAQGGGGEDPKGRPGPWGQREAELTSYWDAVVLAALLGAFATEEIARRWLARWETAHGVAPDSSRVLELAQHFAADLDVDEDQLERALDGIYRDAWLPGVGDALAQLDRDARPDSPAAQAVRAVDWAQWRPGSPPDAKALDSLGFNDMRAQLRAWVREIDDTTRDRIAHDLAEGIRQGWPAQRIAEELQQAVGDPVRAQAIARTEVNRAMSQATLETYRRDQVDEWDLLTALDPCPVCAAVRESNPHPVTDAAEMPPLHPNCRCSLAPHVG